MIPVINHDLNGYTSMNSSCFKTPCGSVRPLAQRPFGGEPQEGCVKCGDSLKCVIVMPNCREMNINFFLSVMSVATGSDRVFYQPVKYVSK